MLILNAPGMALDGRYQPLWVALAERLATYPAGPDLAELSPAADERVALLACR